MLTGASEKARLDIIECGCCIYFVFADLEKIATIADMTMVLCGLGGKEEFVFGCDTLGHKGVEWRSIAFPVSYATSDCSVVVRIDKPVCVCCAVSINAYQPNNENQPKISNGQNQNEKTRS